MILLAILAIVFQSSLIHGYNLFGKRIALPSFVKNTLSVVVCSTCLLNLPVYADISDMDIARAYSSASIRLASSDGEDTATSKLTAGQLLQTDVQPRISLLKDIVTSMNQYESLVTAKDYVSIRQALRTEPAVELRKTCRSLEKYLKADQLKNYKNAYSVMISSIDDLDGVRAPLSATFRSRICPNIHSGPYPLKFFCILINYFVY